MVAFKKKKTYGDAHGVNYVRAFIPIDGKKTKFRTYTFFTQGTREGLFMRKEEEIKKGKVIHSQMTRETSEIADFENAIFETIINGVRSYIEVGEATGLLKMFNDIRTKKELPLMFFTGQQIGTT